MAAAPGRRADRRIPTPVALASRDGRVLTPFAAHLEVAQDASGGYMARTNQRLWQISRDTTSVREISDADITPLGGWLGIQRSDRLGYVDSSGSWQIAPERLGGSVFHGSPARALRLGHQEGQEDRLVDTQGNTVATLPVGDWSWPTGSDWLIRQRHVANQGMVTDYFDTDGKPKLSAVPGRVGATRRPRGESAGQRPGARGQRAGQARRPGLRRAVAAPRRLGGGARGPALRLR